MAKYSVIELTVKNGKIVNVDGLNNNQKNALESQYVIYIYRSTKSNKVYIGQTGDFLNRNNQHFYREEKFKKADFDKVLVIVSKEFNRSSLDDVERQLITYFAADTSKEGKSTKLERVSYDKDTVINGTGGNRVNDYVGRENIVSDVILPVWEKELYSRGWVTTPTLDELRANELFKYSPIKQLTAEQGQLITEIVNSPDKSYVINGDAGTGKTVLLTHLVAGILKERPDAKIGVVVQPNWEETGSNIFEVYGMNNSNLTVASSTTLISSENYFDVIVVDESHKLSRDYGKQHPSFGKAYKIPEYNNCASHLEILQKMGKQIILMYDVLQAIRPANIPREMFQDLTSGYEKRFLRTQFRIQAPKGKTYTSDDYINGIKYLLFKDTGLLDSKLTNFDPNFNRDVFKDTSDDAYFGYVTGKPMHQLIDWVEEDRNYNPENIDRVLSGMFCCETADKWQQSDGKDPSITHFHEDGLDRRWNSTQKNWINVKDADAEDQIGSVFAVQGIDLNKVGVMIGPDIKVTENGELEAVSEKHNNENNKFTKSEMELPSNQFEFTLFILNQYYVLMTRGIDGIRLGFWENEGFQKYMEETFDLPAKEEVKNKSCPKPQKNTADLYEQRSKIYKAMERCTNQLNIANKGLALIAKYNEVKQKVNLHSNNVNYDATNLEIDKQNLNELEAKLKEVKLFTGDEQNAFKESIEDWKDKFEELSNRIKDIDSELQKYENSTVSLNNEQESQIEGTIDDERC